MERLVCDLTWMSRLSWIISILMFVAVVVFGAPPITMLWVIVGELVFFSVGRRWYRDRQNRR